MDVYNEFVVYLSLSDSEKDDYLASLLKESPSKAHALEKLLNTPDDFTQPFLEAVQAISEDKENYKIGDTVGVYELTEALGHGGMGQVFKAERADGKIEQTVAIKFLHPLFYQYQSGKLLYREAQALAKLNHPNIASILDIAEEEYQQAYIVMEYVDGSPLDEYLLRNNLNTSDKLNLYKKIVDAVLEAHTKQVIHADIKPSNIIVTQSGEPKLIDFGVTQLANKQPQSTELVKHYLCAMTVNYAAPEQLKGEQASVASDIYSLGSLLYFILCNQSPYQEVGGALQEKVAHISEASIPTLSPITAISFQKQLQSIVNKSLAKEPENRYRSVSDLLNDIVSFQQYKPISANAERYASQLWFYRHRFIVITAIMLILLAGLSVWQIMSEKQALQLANAELKNNYQNQLLTMHDVMNDSSPSISYPNPDNLSTEQYVNLMLVLTDNFLKVRDYDSANTVLERLNRTLLENPVDEYTEQLIQFRALYSDLENKEGRQQQFEELIHYFLSNSFDIRLLDVLRIIRIHYALFTDWSDALSFINFVEKGLSAVPHSDDNVQKLNYGKSAYYMQMGEHDKALAITKDMYQRMRQQESLESIYLVDYLEAISDYIEIKQNLGQYDETHDSLKIELSKTLQKVDQNNPLYWFHISSVLTHYRETDFKKAYTLFKELTPAEEEIMLNNLWSSFLSMYDKLGEYDKGLRLSGKGVEKYQRVVDESSDLYVKALSETVRILLYSGEAKLAIEKMDTLLAYLAVNNLTINDQTYYKTRVCFAGLLYGSFAKFDEICSKVYFERLDKIGRDYWTDDALHVYVLWLSTQEPIKDELQYVKQLEQVVMSSQDNVDIKKRTKGLISYYIARGDTQKLQWTIDLQRKALFGLYDDVPVIDKYLNSLYQVEAHLLRSETEEAKALIHTTEAKLCTYENKVPIKKYMLKLANKTGYQACKV